LLEVHHVRGDHVFAAVEQQHLVGVLGTQEVEGKPRADAPAAPGDGDPHQRSIS
jgi:hypothetical protein